MDFAFSEAQLMLRDSARKLLADRVGAERLHRLADAPDEGRRAGGVDTELWAEVLDLGWVALGAADGDFLDEAVLVEECGYALAPIPFLSTTTAWPALLAAGLTDPRSATVAWAEPSGALAFGDPDALQSVAVPSGAEPRLRADKCDVPDLGAVQLVAVVARDGGPGGGGAAPVVALLDLATADPGSCTVTLDPTIDGTRRVGRLTVDVDAPSVASAGQDVASAMRRRAHAGLALESVGVAQRALDLAVTHASTREQFGRVIGTYQAVSHRIADVYVGLELARSLAYRAAWYVATSEQEPGAVAALDVDAACSAAKAAAGEAGVQACEALIQVLGGMGMTWEHVAHRYYKRALANRSYAGTPAHHRALVAAALLDT